MYKGILSASNLFSNHHQPENEIGFLVKRKNIYVRNNDTLRTAVETMAKENVDVLPVVSNDNNHITGILSYRNIIATYKHNIAEHQKKQPHISLKRQGLKILLHGQKFSAALKRKEK